VRVVGGNVPEVVALAKFEQGAVEIRQLTDGVILKLNEKIIRAISLDIPFKNALPGFNALVEDGARDLAGHAGSGGDDPLAVGAQEIMIDARVIIKSFQLGGAGDLEQVFVTGHVFSEQHQVVRVFVFLGIAVIHPACGHIGFNPDDGFNTRINRRLEEIDHAEHGAVIGDGHRVHAQFLHALDQLFDIAEAVEQRVFCMNMQVGERHLPVTLSR